MIPFISFLIGIQIIHTLAASTASSFVYPSCNSLVVKDVADEALNKVNLNRKQGYVLGLLRIFDVHELPQDGDSVFFLVLDVWETKCHVWSKKPWKECEFRDPYDADFGQCEIIIKFNRNSDDSIMYINDCILHPYFTPACPGCPIRQNPSEDSYQEIARKSLAKFNAENCYNYYFAIVEVTKASSQVVSGILEAIEFTIQETSCHKIIPMSDITQCSLLPTEIAERGLCKVSVLVTGAEVQEIDTANCEFFPNACDHQELHHPHVDAAEISTEEKETVVRVINHHPSSKDAVPEVQKPNHCSSPTPGEKANSHLAKPAKLTIPPFPKGFSYSASCPGEVAIKIPGLKLPSPPPAEASKTKSDV